jgi:C4-dicarboxylate-specific signal transduction histidine kinase
MFMLKKPFERIEVLQLAHTLVERRRLNGEAKMRLEKLHGTVQARTKSLEKMSRALQAEIAQLKQTGTR